MEDILIFVLVVSVILQFWQLRNQAEAAVYFAKHYCEKNDLQYIACARTQTRLTFFKRNLIAWRSHYMFEFSGNGEDKAQGLLIMQNQQLIEITAEAYKV